MKVTEVQDKIQKVAGFILNQYSQFEHVRQKKKRHDIELTIKNISENGFKFIATNENFDKKADGAYEVEGTFKYENNGIVMWLQFYENNSKLHEYQATFKLNDEEVKCEGSQMHSDPGADLKKLTYKEQ